MKKHILLFLISCSICASVCAATDEAWRRLWDIPTKEVVAWTTKTYDQKGVRVEEINYYSRYYKTFPVKIFGYYAYPIKRSGQLPAILLSHGGGGTASRPRAVAWAKRGFAVLAIDLPGKGENRPHSRSTGPNMDVPTILRTEPDISNNYLVHAVAAVRNGITFLTQRKEVDPDRIGMIGLSWGGVLTLLTNGQDDRLKAAVNVFGAGHIPEGCTWEDRFFSMSSSEITAWNDQIDPKGFLATQHAPILFITGTNDHCYYLPTFQKSYEEVKAEKNFYLIPNLRHRFLSSAQIPGLAWLEQKLKTGGTFPKITELKPSQISAAADIVVPVKIFSSAKISSVILYYDRGGPNGWTAKKWQMLLPQKNGKDYLFKIPAGLIKPDLLYYVSVKDQRGGAASTLARSLFAVKLKDGTKTFALSSPIRKIFQHELPITFLNGAENNNINLSYSKTEKIYTAF